MSKKSGTIIKVVAFAAGIAAVGAACYVYRDKIKEFAEKNDVKGKVNSAKNFVTDQLQKNKNEDDFDDSEFFDELDSEDSSSRGYTSITINSDEDSSSIKEKAVELKDAVVDKAKEIKETVTKKAKDVKETAKDKAENAADTAKDKAEEIKETVAEKASDIKDAVEEAIPEEYEYEGLSDVSEDEDALAEEAALDGV